MKKCSIGLLCLCILLPVCLFACGKETITTYTPPVETIDNIHSEVDTSDIITETEAEAQTEAKTESETESQTEDETEPVTEAKTEPVTEAESSPSITDIPELVPTVLSQYFETYGFASGLDQSEFVDGVLGKFSFEGTPLSEFPMAQFDGELNDGGYTCGVSFFEPVSGDKTISIGHRGSFPKTGEDSYRYSLATQVPLEGFALPYGMEFGMTFAEAWEIMGMGNMTDIGMEEIVLYHVGNETLTAYREFDDPDTLADAYRIKLIFTETAQVGTGTRRITISFITDETLCDSLYEIEISVFTQGNASFGESTPPEVETDPIPTINLIPNTDIHKITQCLVDHGFGTTLDSGEFLDKVLAQYRYLGIPLTKYNYKRFSHDLPEEEGISEHGWVYEDKSVNYKWSRRSLADDEYTRTGSLGGKTIISGLTLPYGMCLGDTYAQVFRKMGAEELTLTDTTTVLYEDDRITLTLKSTPEASDYTHHLVYEESFFYVHRIVISDVTVRSRDVNAKRTLTISFLPDGTLGYFNMEVQETFSPETIELLTPPPAEEITSPEEATQMKAKVYATLDKLHFYSDMHPVFYVPVYWDQDLYDTYFRPLGKEAVPYILQYVMESSYSKFPKDGIDHYYSWAWEEDFWNMYYFVGAAYALIGMPEPSDGWYGFPSSGYIEAHEYAAELYKHLHEHINTDPALWGSYTPAEDAINRLELLPLNATMTKEITEAFFDTMISEDAKKHFTAEDLSIRYYGYYALGYVVFVDGILEYTEAFETEEIDGYVFEYNSGQKLLYYKNGHFYTLTEVDYILNNNSIRTLYEVYTQK